MTIVVRIGYLLEDIEEKRPDAVIDPPGGQKMLRYEALGENVGSLMRRGR